MRKYKRVNAATIQDSNTRRALESVDVAIQELYAGVGKVGAGYKPESTGTSIELPPIPPPILITPATAVTVDVPAGGNLQDYIDAVQPYSTLRLAAAVFTAADANGFIIDKPITLEGAAAPYIWDGIGPPVEAWTTGTVLRPYNPTNDTDGAMNSTALTIIAGANQSLAHVTIKNLGIENPYTFPDPPATMGTGDGIRVDTTAVGAYVAYLRIEDVAIRFMGRDALHLDGGSGTSGGIDQSTISRLHLIGSRRHGFYMTHCFDIACDNMVSVGNQRCGGYVTGCNLMPFYHCLFNGNGRALVSDGSATWNGGTGDWPYYDQAQLYFNGCARLTLTAMDFEVWTGEYISGVWSPFNVQKALAFYSCTSGVITGCSVYNAHYEHGAIESYFISFDALCRGFFVAGNQVAACDFAVIAHTSLGSIGNVVLQNTPTDYGDPAPAGNIAPCRVSVSNQTDADDSTPTGGNLVLMPIMDARTIDSGRLSQFLAGIQIPAVSAASVVTSTVQRGTVIYDVAAGGLQLHQGGAWQAVAAGLVSYEGDIVTYDDEPISY